MSLDATSRELRLAHRDTLLRFAIGVAFAFVFCEAVNWRPTALAPVLTGVLLANIPMRPPLKLGLVIIGAMVVASLFVCLLSVLLRDTPAALWLAVGIVFFAAYLAKLRGAPGLPVMLLLICLAIIPVVAIASPQNVGALPDKLIKSIVVATLLAWAMHALFPRIAPAPRPPPKAYATVHPVAIALAATSVVMPVMLLYLLYSPTQALPVMLATVVLASHFDVDDSARDAYARVAANAIGGALGTCAHLVLLAAPSLVTLSLLSFLLAFGMGVLIMRGKVPFATVVLANNGCFVIFSSAISQGPATLGIVLERLAYFSLAGLFVVGAMHLAWSVFDKPRADPQPA